MKNNQIFNFAKKIIHFPRSLTGEGVRNTLKEVRNILPNLKLNHSSQEKKFLIGKYLWNGRLKMHL